MNKTLLIIFIFLATWANAQQHSVSLAGDWRFKLDSADRGTAEKWFTAPNFKQSITLPGTLDDRGIGTPPALDTTVINEQVLQRLARRHRYIGPVWYAKTFSTEAGGRFELYLERVIWRTDCWVDGVYRGYQDALSGPQYFVLNNLRKGKHTIVLKIDNRKQFDISIDNLAAAYTDDTQIIWNGVIGNISLVKLGSVSIADIQVYHGVDKNSIRVTTALQNNNGGKHHVKARIEVFDGSRLVGTGAATRIISDSSVKSTVNIKLGHLALWDEFHPHLYQIRTKLIDEHLKVLAEKELTTGFRTLSNLNSQIQVNGRRVFMRGTLECNVFPLEGHSPMDKAGWIKVFKTAKSYGLNHIRFHSWCPPEAAFAAADSMGFYLHIELPLWSLTVGKDKPTLGFLKNEAERIARDYGNHPSFCFWSMGNELEGDFNWLNKLVTTLKNEDPRHLYTSSTFSFQEGHGKWPEPVADYFVTQYTRKGWVRGQGIFNTNPPDFQTDYSTSVDSIPVPLIIHEMGQYSVYPDLKEIKDYTGVLDPLNLKAIRYDLTRKNMLSLDQQFVNASGKLAVILYKEEIERALKTPGISGFQLLDLHDFPGQGTALVGLLNAFWKSKGLISPAEFRMFCSPVVPLLRFKKATYTNNETFAATAQLANFSDKALVITPEWSVTDESNHVLFNGQLKKQRVEVGNQNRLGNFQFSLSGVKTATQMCITLSVPGTTIKNQWKIWVYPAEINDESEKVRFTTSPEEALKYLAQGDRVILNPDTQRIAGISGRFAPVFWSPVHFTNQPGTMGLLCDVKHPALADFPTAQFADWQWWDLVTQSKALIIDSINYRPQPIVRVVDNFFKNKKLADIIEFKVGQGKLILCSMDIHSDLQNRPEARQLKYSLMKYAGGELFNPRMEIDPQQLKRFFK